MSLTDTTIRTTKPGEKPAKLSDEKGLYLLVSPAGGKWWRMDYRFSGKRKTLSMGVYPDVGLKEARGRRDEARKLLADGIDPGEHRKVRKAAKLERTSNSFEAVAREWFAKHSPNWATTHADKIIQRLDKDVFSWLGGKPIAEITAPELLTVLRRIENRGRWTLHTGHIRTADRYFAMPWQPDAPSEIPPATFAAHWRRPSMSISRQSRNRWRWANYCGESTDSRAPSLCNPP